MNKMTRVDQVEDENEIGRPWSRKLGSFENGEKSGDNMSIR